MRAPVNFAIATTLLLFGAAHAQTRVPPPAPSIPKAVEALRQLKPGVEAEHFPIKGDSGPTSWSTGAYSYDPAGNIIAIGSQYFYYDTNGRLKYANIDPGTGAQQQAYAYDAYGNMNGRQLPGQTMTPIGVTGGTNHLTGYSVQYDDGGNVKSWTANGDTITYTHDGMNMLQQVSDTNGHTLLYIYTADEERVWIYDLINNVSHWKIRDLGGHVLRDFVQDGNTWSVARDYFYRKDRLLASSIPSTGFVTHFSLDHLGTPKMLTDQNGGKVGFHVYWPFGDEWSSAGLQESPAETLKFTGHERDLDLTGYGEQLDYMHARFFQPGLGRFLSLDPVMADSHQPQTWNRYVYVLNSPIGHSDPTGKALDVYGTDQQKRDASAIANSSMFGQELQIKDNGEAHLVSNGVQGPPTQEQAAAASNLQEVIDNKAHTEVNLTSGSSQVLVGDFKSKTIDVEDMKQLGTGPGYSQGAAFGHEIREQFNGQVLHTPDPAGRPAGFGSHILATNTESCIAGYNINMAPAAVQQTGAGAYDITRTATSFRNGETQVIVIHIKDLNITGVDR